MIRSVLTAAALALMAAGAANAQGVKRVDRPPGTLSNTVTVPANYETIYISGTTSGSGGTPTPPGADTEAQATIIYEKFKTWLATEKLTLGDIVSMRIYLVADPAKGPRMDTAGSNAAYAKYFGTAEQPNKPTRATVQVVALGGPTTFIEIEAIAVRKK